MRKKKSLRRVVLLSLLLLASGCQALRREAALTRLPHVVLISIDTLHVAWTGPYNAEVTTTPFLDRLAAEGVRFESAYTHVPITLPSHASLMTGVSPVSLGVLANGDEVPERAVTLAEILGEAGYRTAAFISLGVLRPAFRLDQGFDDYHDPFENGAARWYRNAAEVFEPVKAWLERYGQDPFFLWVHFSDPHEPYLPPGAPPDAELWLDDELSGTFNLVSAAQHRHALSLPPGRHRLRFVSLREPHPDDRPETGIRLQLSSTETLEEYADESLPDMTDGIGLQPSWELTLTNPKREPVEIEIHFTGWLERPAPSDVLPHYEAEVAYTDRYLAKLDALLASQGIREDTLFIVVTDHGEGLFSHDLLGHASHVYEDQLRVLWMMRGAGLPEGRVVADRPALLTDVAPTLLDLLGLSGARSMEGRSWVDCLRGGRCPDVEPWWSFGIYHGSRRLNAMAGYRWPYKWIWQRSFPRSGYHLSEDPWEQNDLLADPGPDNPKPLKEAAESFRDARRVHAEALRRPRREIISGERERMLRSLGYLEGSEPRERR